MKPLPNLSDAEELLHRELGDCLRTVRELATGDPTTLEDGVERLRLLRRSVYESINQIQHESLILKAARLLQEEHAIGPDALWEWNPRQTGKADEPDLRMTVEGEIKISVEATASEAPIGIIDTRMSRTLAKLNAMPGKKYYFVRTDRMLWRAKTKVKRAGLEIDVFLPHEDQVPLLHIRRDAEGKYRIPRLEDQTRPRLIRAVGRVELEPLPIFTRFLKVSEDWYNLPGLRNEYCGLPVIENLHIVEPISTRYGWLPMWFPSTDSQGRKLSPTSQADRFLCFLGEVIHLPDDHRKMEPIRLVMGLFELYDSYQSDAFLDWDEGHRWRLIGDSPPAEMATIDK